MSVYDECVMQQSKLVGNTVHILCTETSYFYVKAYNFGNQIIGVFSLNTNTSSEVSLYFTALLHCFLDQYLTALMWWVSNDGNRLFFSNGSESYMVEYFASQILYSEVVDTNIYCAGMYLRHLFILKHLIFDLARNV
jgi:hypothetical protein